MKFVLALLFLAGLAFAEPELAENSGPNPDADAAPYYYGYYGRGYGLGYGGYHGGYYGGYGGYGYYGRKKREADPAVLATTHAGPIGVVPHAYALGVPYLHHAVPHAYTVAHKGAVVTPAKVTATVAHTPFAYAGHYGYGLPYAYGRKKREADSDADADADADALYYGYYGRGYGLGYGGYHGGYYGGYPGYGYYYGK